MLCSATGVAEIVCMQWNCSFNAGCALCARGDDHLEMSTFAEKQSPVPLLLGHQIVCQPHLCQTDQVGQSIKLGHVRDSIRGKVQELKASEVGEVCKAPQPVVPQM